MVQYYTIFGRKVASEYIAISVLATVIGGASLLAGGKKAAPLKQPALNAGSKDEENFITEFLKSAEQDSKGAKH